MRFFRLNPAARPSVLLVESGSRRLLDGVIPYLRQSYGNDVPISLVTCFAGAPAGLAGNAAVYRVHEYRGGEGRKRLYGELRRAGVSVLVMISSGEPIMTQWKWALALRLPVQVLIVNENGDFFWCNRTNWKTIRQFALYRAGLAGGEAAGTIGQMLLFPLTLTWLLLYAAAIHLRRKVQL